MRKFKVGDRVRIIKAVVDPSLLGTICSVIGELTPWTHYGEPYYGYRLDIRHRDDSVIVAPPDWLEPVYDGNEKVSWSSVIWKPRALVKS